MSLSYGFKDIRAIPDWAKDDVGASVEKGVISSYTDGTFGGVHLFNRSEIADKTGRPGPGMPPECPGSGLPDVGTLVNNSTTGTSALPLYPGLLYICPWFFQI